MSSSPVDKSTMNKASSGAMGVNNTLSGISAGNTAFQNQQRNAMFGPNGSLTGLMNPSTLSVTSPSGAYATQYANERNMVNQGADQAVRTTNLQTANMGGGLQPSGYGAAQRMSAYQGAANQNSANYAATVANQQQNNQQNFWNATNAYGNAGQNAGAQALQGLGTAVGSYDNMYGDASRQKDNGWMNAGNTLANMGRAASGFKW